MNKKIIKILWALLLFYGCNGNICSSNSSGSTTINNNQVSQTEKTSIYQDNQQPDKSINNKSTNENNNGLNPNPPDNPIKIVFIHHSTGEDWLKPDGGNLRKKLNDSKYYVTDTNYEWGPSDQDVNDGKTIGYHTDIGHWYNWFLGPHRNTYLNALYKNTNVSDAIGRNTISDPGASKLIIIFKSCFSTAQSTSGNPDDQPLSEGQKNPLRGKGLCDDEQCTGDRYYSVENIKGLYRDLLSYFITQQDKLFILITTPPSHDQAVGSEIMDRLRAINNWLVRDWLDNYQFNNVAVFDYYNVLTSKNAHHRFRNGSVEHITGNSNFLAYPSPGPDNHPSAAGHKRATEEFVPLLNIAVHCWMGEGCPELMGRER